MNYNSFNKAKKFIEQLGLIKKEKKSSDHYNGKQFDLIKKEKKSFFHYNGNEIIESDYIYNNNE